MIDRNAWATILVALFGFLGTTSATAGQDSVTPAIDEPARFGTGRATDDISLDSISRANAPAVFDTVFDCEGSILHQSVDGEIQSSLTFWFGVGANMNVAGMITKMGSPLALPVQSISGDFTAKHDIRDEFIGGKLDLAWPYVADEARVELAMMRETFVRVGPRVNGVSKIKRRTSNHTYVAGRVQFDPKSHTAVASLRRVAFITATCFPTPELPVAGSPQM